MWLPKFSSRRETWEDYRDCHLAPDLSSDGEMSYDFCVSISTNQSCVPCVLMVLFLFSELAFSCFFTANYSYRSDKRPPI
jgi:hypothetical protein